MACIYSSLSLVESLTLLLYCIRREFGWKYRKRRPEDRRPKTYENEEPLRKRRPSRKLRPPTKTKTPYENKDPIRKWRPLRNLWFFCRKRNNFNNFNMTPSARIDESVNTFQLHKVLLVVGTLFIRSNNSSSRNKQCLSIAQSNNTLILNGVTTCSRYIFSGPFQE